jgi:hypothetical protein
MSPADASVPYSVVALSALDPRLRASPDGGCRGKPCKDPGGLHRRATLATGDTAGRAAAVPPAARENEWEGAERMIASPHPSKQRPSADPGRADR